MKISRKPVRSGGEKFLLVVCIILVLLLVVVVVAGGGGGFGPVQVLHRQAFKENHWNAK